MLKVGTFLLALGLIFAGAYGVVLVVSPETIAGSTLEARSGEVLANVRGTGAADALIVQTRHLGIFAVCIALAMFFILFKGFAKGAKWGWWAFLFIGGLSWGYGLIIQILEGDMMNMFLHLIGFALLVLGLLIPIKAFFAPQKQ